MKGINLTKLEINGMEFSEVELCIPGEEEITPLNLQSISGNLDLVSYFDFTPELCHPQPEAEVTVRFTKRVFRSRKKRFRKKFAKKYPVIQGVISGISHGATEMGMECNIEISYE